MSDAIKRLHDYLAKSPSVVYPEDVLAYLPAIEAENAKLRELLQRALASHDKMCANRGTCLGCLLFNAKPFASVCPIVSVTRDARELGIEVE